MHIINYPLPLAIAYIFIAGYLARTIFISVRLPGAVGIMLTGFALSAFMEPELLEARDTLQEFAFFLVLLTAGFEISLPDVKPHVVLIALLPASLELLGIALCAFAFLGLDVAEALVLGTVLCALGDGLVIPKLLELGNLFPNHPLPRVIFIAAPLEVSFTLTVFGMLRGLSDAKDAAPTPPFLLILSNLTNILLTLLLGASLGAGCAWMLPRRTSLALGGRQLFTGTKIEALLLFAAVGLAAFSLGLNAHDETPFVPIGFAPGSAFSSELLVIVIAAAFAACVENHLLLELEEAVGAVWVVGQLVLFSMLGSKTMIQPFRESCRTVFPLMIAGLAFRALGVAIAVRLTVGARTCMPQCTRCARANRRALLPDIGMCFVVSLPRATIQGALAGIPLHDDFFFHNADGADATRLISHAGRIYVVTLATIGSIIMDSCAPMLLRTSLEWADRHAEGRTTAVFEWEEGWTARRRARAGSSRSSGGSSESDLGLHEGSLSLPLHQLEASIKRGSRHVRSDGVADRHIDFASAENIADRHITFASAEHIADRHITFASDQHYDAME